jgi:hypothetical protein
MNAGRGTAQFRIDGSILFSNQTDAYNRIWNNDLHTGREQIGIILNDDQVLVAPDYNNDIEGNSTEGYGYNWKNGNVYDPVIGHFQSVLATIHAHTGLSDPSPSTRNFSGDKGDLGYFSERTPNKLFLTLGEQDNHTHAIIAKNYYNWAHVPDRLLPSVTKVLNGYDLIDQIRYIQNGIQF